MRLIFGCFFFLMLASGIANAQDPCTYKPSSKRGGYWVFSSFYQPDTQTPLEGECRQLNNGKPYLYRVFSKGRLIEEVLYTTENRLVSSLKMLDKRKDSTLGELKSYWENGNLALHERYFVDKTGRRCMHRISYHVNGKPRFNQYFAWVKASELTDYQLPYHPPHTIDEDGYSTLCVPFHREQIFDESVRLVEEKYHQLLMDGSHEFASLHGPYLRFHHNGKKQHEGTYKNGKLHGEWTAFTFLGDTLEYGNFDNGLKDGLWIYKYDNGKIKAEHRYDVAGKYPFTAQKQEWSPAGKLVLQFYFNENGTAVLKEWSEEGVLIHEQRLVNMSLEGGMETFWFTNGQMKSLLDNRPGADTLYQEWYENGRDKALKRIVPDSRGEKMEISEWFPNGYLKEIREVYGGEFVQSYSRRTYFENGNVQFVEIQKNRERIIEEYASNGIKTRALFFLDGKLNGTYQQLDSLGQVRLVIGYKQGLRHGDYRYYSPLGEVLYEAFYEEGLWLSQKSKTKSYIQNFERQDASVKKTCFSAAHYLLNQRMHGRDPVRLAQGHVDSLAAVIWQLQRLVPHYADWITRPLIGGQMLRIRLLESYFRDIHSGTNLSDFSTELLAGLKILQADLPTFQFVQGEAEVSVPLSGWMNQAYAKRLFPRLQSFIHLENKAESESGGFSVYPRYTVESVHASCHKITIQVDEKRYTILLYADGTAELEHQSMPWSEFLETDLTPLNPPDYHE